MLKKQKKQYSHNKHTMLSATLRIDAAFHINKLCNVNPEATEKQTIIFAKWSITLHSQWISVEMWISSQKIIVLDVITAKVMWITASKNVNF